MEEMRTFGRLTSPPVCTFLCPKGQIGSLLQWDVCGQSLDVGTGGKSPKYIYMRLSAGWSRREEDQQQSQGYRPALLVSPCSSIAL